MKPDDLFKCLQLVARAAEETGFRMVQATEFDNWCLVFYRSGVGFVRLDFDTEVAWSGVEILSVAEVSSEAILRDGLPVPRAAHEILILLCQCAWSGKVKDAYRSRIQVLLCEEAG
ncbi:hypothetical protein N8489_01030, partial [Akkermansiaceae bacterium]|nr:hypothetical protein [Akkermansiaceae bacterium]